jgi:hypothetical protein
MTGKGRRPTGGGGGPGPWLLDQITPQPTAAYSTRKVKSTATNAIRVCDGSGTVGTSAAIGFDGSSDLNLTDLGTFFSGTGGSIGANCNGWYDQSGGGHDHLSVATGANHAILKMSSVDSGAVQTLNSHPAPYHSENFGRTILTSTLHWSDLVSASAFTIIQTMRQNGAFGSGDIGTSPILIGMMSDGNDGYMGSAIFVRASGVNSMRAQLFTGGATKSAILPSAADTNYVVVTRLSSGSLSVWLNGGSPNTATSVGDIPDLNYQTMTIGHASNEVWLLETFVYNVALSNSDINTLCTASGVTNGNIASRAGVTWTNI